MGILDFIFGKTIKINDTFFGKMLFLDDKKNPENEYFECSRNFEPSNDIIDIGIEADVSGPTELRKDFFKKIESNYDEIISTIKPVIINEFKKWEDNFEITDFRNEFKAVYLFLPRCEKQPIVWKISFETILDLNHVVSLTMSDFNLKEILIDG